MKDFCVGYSGQIANVFSRQGLVWACTERNIKRCHAVFICLDLSGSVVGHERLQLCPDWSPFFLGGGGGGGVYCKFSRKHPRPFRMGAHSPLPLRWDNPGGGGGGTPI